MYLVREGVPETLDRAAWPGEFGPAESSRLASACLFLRLIDKLGRATPALEELLKSHEEGRWKSSLDAVLRDAYAPIFELALEHATLVEVSARFKQCYEIDGPALRKCIEFFLGATRDTGLILSPNLLSKHYGVSPHRKAKLETRKLDEELVNKLPNFDPAWPDQIKEQWFQSYLELVQRTKDGQG